MADIDFLGMGNKAKPSTESAVGGGIGGLLGMATGNPLLSALLAQAGSYAFSKILGQTSPYEEAAGSMLAAQQELLPQLQRQAAGLPTVATENIKRQLRQEGTRQGQAFAASASRQGIRGTTPGAAQQGRVAAATTQAIGNQLGQAQLAAQQQLLGVGAQGLQAQGIAEQQQAAQQQQFMSDIGAFMGWYGQNKTNPMALEMMGLLRKLLGYQSGFMGQMLQGPPPKTPTPEYPLPSMLNPPAPLLTPRQNVFKPKSDISRAFGPGGV